MNPSQPVQTAPSPRWPAHLAFALERPQGNIVHNLLRAADRAPTAPALHFYGTTIDYGTLRDWVEALAATLRYRLGVRPGDRVMLDMQNCPQFIAAYQAILRADAVVVPVNPMLVTRELDYIANDSGARVALIGDELVDRFAPLIKTRLDAIVVARYADALADPSCDPLPEVMDRPPIALPAGSWHAFQDAITQEQRCPPSTADSHDLAALPYSSGSTGAPKACRHTHATLMFTAVAQAKWYDFGPKSVLTAFMPLFHVAGMQASMAAGLYAGASLVLMTRWDRDLVPSLLARHKVTFWSAAPTMIADVMAGPVFDGAAFDHLKVLTGGGAPMPAALAERLEARYGLRFCEGYGLTETISATHINPLDAPKRQCLGIPIFETLAMIIDPQTLEALVDDQVGELLISGPQVMESYWQAPQASTAAFIHIEGQRFLRTGDLAYRDAEGYYFIVDRLKRMISVSGYKVSPAECEAILYGHPAVAECCVISAPDPYRGEIVKAMIVPETDWRDRIDADEIVTFARKAMAAYKIPRAIEFVDELPHTGSKKVDWRMLQERQWQSKNQ